MEERSAIAHALSLLILEQDVPPLVARPLIEAAQVVAAPRDDADPMQLRRDVQRIVSVLEKAYGADAIDMAKRIAAKLGSPPFARVIVRALERKERLRSRAGGAGTG